MPCPDYGLDMTAISLKYHIRKLHVTYPDIDWERLPVTQHDNLPQLYEVIYPKDTKKNNAIFQGAQCRPTPEAD